MRAEKDEGEKGETGKNGGKEAEISENTKLRTLVRYQEDSTSTLSLTLWGPLELLHYSCGNMNCNLEGSFAGS